MRHNWLRARSVCILAALLCSASLTRCAATGGAESGAVAAVDWSSEPLLIAAGFHTVPANTPEQHQALGVLPAGELRVYPTPMGPSFWFADPYHCKCVLVGDSAAFRKFQDLKLQQEDLIAYEEQALYGWAPMLFPPAILLASAPPGGLAPGGHGHHGAVGPVAAGGGAAHGAGMVGGHGGGFAGGVGGLGGVGGHGGR